MLSRQEIEVQTGISKKTIQCRPVWKCDIKRSVIANISDGKPMKSFYVALRTKLYMLFENKMWFALRGKNLFYMVTFIWEMFIKAFKSLRHVHNMTTTFWDIMEHLFGGILIVKRLDMETFIM